MCKDTVRWNVKVDGATAVGGIDFIVGAPVEFMVVDVDEDGVIVGRDWPTSECVRWHR